MEDIFATLADLFSRRVIVMENTKDARALVAQQHDLYAMLTSVFSNVPFDDNGALGTVSIDKTTGGVFETVISFTSNNRPDVLEHEGKVYVRAIFPVLDYDLTHALAESVRGSSPRSTDTARMYAPALAGAFMDEFSLTGISSSLQALLNSDRGLVFLTAIARYGAAKTSLEQRIAIGEQLEKRTLSLRGALQNYTGEFDILRTKQGEELRTLAAQTAEANERVSQFGSSVDEAHARLVNFETSIREELRLDRSRLTWERRFKEAEFSFYVSCALLASFLVITILAAWLCGLRVITALTAAEIASSTGQAGADFAIALTHQVGRLVVLSVPIAVYLWMLKALMRYFMRSMLLMDDARQRQTMLDTYFLLSEKGRADERDRPLILWALFRQTPGHGPDGIEPPDFTEVINAGMKRAGDIRG